MSGAHYSEQIRGALTIPRAATAYFAAFTTCFTTFDVLPRRLESLPYTAVMESLPTGRVDVAKVAVPPLSIPVPSNVEPCINETVSPSAGAPPFEVTTAVNVTV